jgi:Uma2 family endonuclease
MPTTLQWMTTDELLRMPRGRERHELVEGELRTMAPSGFEHGSVTGTLTILLGIHVRSKRLGIVLGAETGFILSRDPDTVRAPDIAFVARRRIPKPLPKGYWPGCPDLAVEVVSPNDLASEVDEKVKQWLAAGTPLVWVIHPGRKTVTAYRSGAAPIVLGKKDVLEADPVLHGFRCRVEEIF